MGEVIPDQLKPLVRFSCYPQDEKAHQTLSQQLGEDKLPRNAYYGDAFERRKRVFDGQEYDVLLLANLITCQGLWGYRHSLKEENINV